MKFERVELPAGAILYDQALAADPGTFFDRQALAAQQALVDARGGRGSVAYIRREGREFVLRQYLRGGVPARIEFGPGLNQGRAPLVGSRPQAHRQNVIQRFGIDEFQ